MAKKRSKWNDAKVLKVFRKRAAAARMLLACEYVEGAAKLLCPVDLGNLRSSINNKVKVSGSIIEGRIGTHG